MFGGFPPFIVCSFAARGGRESMRLCLEVRDRLLPLDFGLFQAVVAGSTRWGRGPEKLARAARFFMSA